MYGGGALLVREVARRTGRGWPTIVVLGAAYALIEEGPIDQMIFNPDYLGLTTFDGLLEIPGTGISLSLVLASLALHTVWSICTPIALVEAFEPSGRPWLRNRGLAFVTVIFVGGSALLTWAQADEFNFFASAAQLIETSAVIAALVVLAFVLPRVGSRPGKSPTPLIAGLAAFALTSIYWGESLITSYVIEVSGWFDAASWCVLLAVALWLALSWSRREGWGPAHVVAVASGAALTYAWAGFFNSTELGIPLAEALVGSAAFSALAVILVVKSNQRVWRDSSGSQRALAS
jgi:hypothetical protein